jgi:hypothetical protein
MKKLIPLFLLLLLVTIGCQSALFTAKYLWQGPYVPPKHNILLKGENRVAIVPRAVFSNAFELQNAPREIARQVSRLLEENIHNHEKRQYRNRKLVIVEQSRVETWLDNCYNDFDSFVEAGRDPAINADIVIAIDIIGFQIRDPRNAHLIQGRCQVQVQAIEVATGKILASEMLMIADPPSSQMPGGPHREPQFRTQFVQVVAQQIAALFHHYNPNKVRRIDADNIEMHRLH